MRKSTIALPHYGSNTLSLVNHCPTQNVGKPFFFNCLFLGLITLFATQVQAQCPTNPQPITFSYNGTTYTANNVSCSTTGDTQYDGWFATHPTTAFRVDGGFDDGRYNCHAFAWVNIKDEWVNTTPTGPNIAPQIYYFSSGKYIQTTDINDAEIAVYGNGGPPLSSIYPVHSAIHLTNTTKSTNGFAVQYLSQNPQFAGWWISKWDGGPLAIHQLSSYAGAAGLQITYFKKFGEVGTNFIQPAQYNASAYSIVGPKAVCTSGAQFNISNVTTGTILALQPGFSITWSGSSHISFSPSTTAYPVTVSSSANGSGEWVKAHITFPDGTSGDLAQDLVWSGAPTYISSISTSQFSAGGTGYIAITVSQTGTDFYAWPFNSGAGDLFPPSGVDSHGASSYTWSCSGLSYNQNPSTVDTRYSAGGFSGTGAAIITVQASNACGLTSEYQTLNVTSGGDYVYSLSPNPASSQVTVSISKNSPSSATGTSSQAMPTAPASGAPSSAPVTYSVRITDLFGMVYYNSNQTGNNFTIPVGNLKNGNYVVVISDGKTVSSKPLLVSH